MKKLDLISQLYVCVIQQILSTEQLHVYIVLIVMKETFVIIPQAWVALQRLMLGARI